jgi:hypothetical protein
MGIEQAIQLFQNSALLIFALTLWNSERCARIAAEKRERELLRDIAKIGSEDT